jgi:hypothetical protein
VPVLVLVLVLVLVPVPERGPGPLVARTSIRRPNRRRRASAAPSQRCAPSPGAPRGRPRRRSLAPPPPLPPPASASGAPPPPRRTARLRPWPLPPSCLSHPSHLLWIRRPAPSPARNVGAEASGAEATSARLPLPSSPAAPAGAGRAAAAPGACRLWQTEGEEMLRKGGPVNVKL